jgi:hypothetical protein
MKVGHHLFDSSRSIASDMGGWCLTAVRKSRKPWLLFEMAPARGWRINLSRVRRLDHLSRGGRVGLSYSSGVEGGEGGKLAQGTHGHPTGDLYKSNKTTDFNCEPDFRSG